MELLEQNPYLVRRRLTAALSEAVARAHPLRCLPLLCRTLWWCPWGAEA